MFTDTHCHVLTKEYDDVTPIITNLKNQGIKRIIINGYDYETNLEVLKLIAEYDNVYGALGVHPNHIKTGVEPTLKLIEEYINHPKIVAIGEVGLDYHYEDNQNEQIASLIKFLALAEKYRKPVIIHNREATGDLLRILKEYQVQGLIHCFSGSLETAQEWIKLGYKLGINGIVTFNNTNLPKILANIDNQNILLETDCPYLTPSPYRGVKNEPKYIKYVADKVAEIYHLKPAELGEILEKNYQEVFDNQARL